MRSADRILGGRTASPGSAVGPLWRFEAAIAADAATVGDPVAERDRLHSAIDAARDELATLIVRLDADSAAILEFQVEMLDDPALLDGILAEIDQGRSAPAAWNAGMTAQMADYQAADDAYFQARASDLDDLRSRVGAWLAGGGGVDLATAPDGAIVVGRDLTPSWFLTADWRRLAGIALEDGSPQSHVAMLARARGVPMLVELKPIPDATSAGLDGEAACLVLDPSAEERARIGERIEADREMAQRAAAALAEPAVTPAGERVACLLNVDDPSQLEPEILASADGVGLWRTEFLFLDRPDLPDEEEQTAAYASLLQALGGRPLLVRTLDIGGDKPLPGVSLPAESNPFLGLRGVRLCLERPDLFRPQLRALLRAAMLGPLKIMLPMVSRAQEIEEARSLIDACCDELRAEGIAATVPPLGMMVETPAAAIAIDTFPVDFASIGSNDLAQYAMAASRDSTGRVASLADPLDPGVLRLISGVVEHGRRSGLEVSLCGDMAAEPAAAGCLLDLGLRRLSVGAAALGRLKLVVRSHGG